MLISSGRSVVDQYFGLEFDTEIKCVEAPEEASTKGVEKFLQYNCYIDKEVKYLASGLKNYMNQVGSLSQFSFYLLFILGNVIPTIFGRHCPLPFLPPTHLTLISRMIR